CGRDDNFSIRQWLNGRAEAHPFKADELFLEAEALSKRPFKRGEILYFIQNKWFSAKAEGQRQALGADH
ncbi:MAG TPA: hypothetical protein VGT04_09690, partial [Acidobacteriaceae bacterium]|nr:hypothetical protein [Acidobacteriaceae bacterium]